MKHQINEGMIETPLSPISHVKGEVWKNEGDFRGIRLHLTLRSGNTEVLRQFRRGRLWTILRDKHYTFDCEVGQSTSVRLAGFDRSEQVGFAVFGVFECHYSCYGLLLSDDPLYLFTERPRGPITVEFSEGVKISVLPSMSDEIMELFNHYHNMAPRPIITPYGATIPGYGYLPRPATNAGHIGPIPQTPPGFPRTTP